MKKATNNKSSKPDLKLTAKQEAFAQAIVSGKSQAEAYRMAYSAGNMKDATIWSKASILMADGKVTARVAELRQPVVEEAQLTLAGHLADLKTLRDKADMRDQTAAAITAEVARGRAAGLYEDTIKLDVDIGLSIDTLTNLEVARRIMHILQLSEERLQGMLFPELAKLLQVETVLRDLGVSLSAPFDKPIPHPPQLQLPAPKEVAPQPAPVTPPPVVMKPEKPKVIFPDDASQAASAKHFADVISGERTLSYAEREEELQCRIIESECRKQADQAQHQTFNPRRAPLTRAGRR